MIKLLQLFTVSLIVLNGCALKVGKVDPELKDVVDSFKQEANKRNRFSDIESIDFYLVDHLSGEEKGVVGTCFYEGKVEILKSYWLRANSAQKENLIFHEAGHCALFKDHVACNGEKVSIMCESMLEPSKYWGNRQKLIDELME